MSSAIRRRNSTAADSVPWERPSERQRELKQVPVAIDYAKTAEARELLTFVAHAYNTVRRIFVVPPDTSPKRLQVLQKAFIDTLNDPALRAEAERSKMEIDPFDAPPRLGSLATCTN